MFAADAAVAAASVHRPEPVDLRSRQSGASANRCINYVSRRNVRTMHEAVCMCVCVRKGEKATGHWVAGRWA
jgi:hypothetical protein